MLGWHGGCGSGSHCCHCHQSIGHHFQDSEGYEYKYHHHDESRSESSSSSPSMIFVTDQTKQLKVKYTSVAEHKRQRRFELNIPKIFKPQILKIEKTVVRSVKVVCEDGPVLEKHMVESEYIEVQEETEVERLRAELAIRDRILTKIAMGSAKAKVKAKPSKRPTKSIV